MFVPIMYEQIKFVAPVLGVLTFLFSVAIWFRGLRADIESIKSNHLAHLQETADKHLAVSTHQTEILSRIEGLLSIRE